ncbi:MAG: HemK2/MTQ2 family protein methyltransferase [Candidatus Odinarchaeia archaeon]
MLIHYNGFKFYIPEDVYPPSEDSFLLFENIRYSKTDEVLEIGTGSGFIIIQIASQVKKAVATDINPKAIEAVVFNSKINNVENLIDFRHGYLFNPIDKGEKFTLIIFNPPYLPTNNTDKVSGLINSSWDGGVNGRNIIDKFIDGCDKFLKDNGRVLLLQSSLSGINETIEKFNNNGFTSKVINRRRFFFEELVVIESVKR